MTIGPPMIVRLPESGVLSKLVQLYSSNNFGAVYWTDGKCEAPMGPDQPWLMKAMPEELFFWTDQVEELGDYYSPSRRESLQRFQEQEGENEQPSEWDDVEFAVAPEARDYQATLGDIGLCNTDEKRKYIHVRMWWLGNDQIRTGAATTLPEIHLENLRQLQQILSPINPHDRIMLAETHRELGDFPNALHHLKFDWPPDYQFAVNTIKSLAEAGKSTVAKLEFPSS